MGDPAGDPQYALDLAVAEVVRAGVAVLVAAGNGDTDACLKSPARFATLPNPLAHQGGLPVLSRSS